MKILVLGATGMLGFQLFKTCLRRKLNVSAIARRRQLLTKNIGENIEDRLYDIDDVKNVDRIEDIIKLVKPDYLINCVGIVKQSSLAEDYYESIAINSLLPHQLERLGKNYNFRLIHISTDCVFSGIRGDYKENDLSDAYDLYGRTKYLGEVGYGNGLTIRTSIIGHEITKPTHGLIEWFLSQNSKVKGFTKAIFSGLTTLELSKVILDVIIPKQLNSGTFQVPGAPISKYDLLKLTAEIYNQNIMIEPSDELVIDRSLSGIKFFNATGYQAPSWPQMLSQMKEDFYNSI
jgi:dTDP-4-dehydrorhamnose reductase